MNYSLAELGDPKRKKRRFLQNQATSKAPSCKITYVENTLFKGI